MTLHHTALKPESILLLHVSRFALLVIHWSLASLQLERLGGWQGWQTWFFKFLVFYGFLEKPGFLH
jgi:hypothetical protein